MNTYNTCTVYLDEYIYNTGNMYQINTYTTGSMYQVNTYKTGNMYYMNAFITGIRLLDEYI